MLHINLQILYIYFIKLNLYLKEFQESNNCIKSYQENKIEFILDKLYIKLKLDSNLNIKSAFQENSQFFTSLCYSCVNTIKFFSTSCHIMMVHVNPYHES